MSERETEERQTGIERESKRKRENEIERGKKRHR